MVSFLGKKYIRIDRIFLSVSLLKKPLRMGIHGLAKLLGDHAPGSMKENEMKNYFGRWFV